MKKLVVVIICVVMMFSSVACAKSKSIPKVRTRAMFIHVGDECFKKALKEYDAKVAQIDSLRSNGNFVCAEFKMPENMKEEGVEYRRCVGQRINAQDYADLLAMYTLAFRANVKSCLKE